MSYITLPKGIRNNPQTKPKGFRSDSLYATICNNAESIGVDPSLIVDYYPLLEGHGLRSYDPLKKGKFVSYKSTTRFNWDTEGIYAHDNCLEDDFVVTTPDIVDSTMSIIYIVRPSAPYTRSWLGNDNFGFIAGGYPNLKVNLKFSGLDTTGYIKHVPYERIACGLRWDGGSNIDLFTDGILEKSETVTTPEETTTCFLMNNTLGTCLSYLYTRQTLTDKQFKILQEDPFFLLTSINRPTPKFWQVGSSILPNDSKIKTVTPVISRNSWHGASISVPRPKVRPAVFELDYGHPLAEGLKYFGIPRPRGLVDLINRFHINIYNGASLGNTDSFSKFQSNQGIFIDEFGKSGTYKNGFTYIFDVMLYSGGVLFSSVYSNDLIEIHTSGANFRIKSQLRINPSNYHQSYTGYKYAYGSRTRMALTCDSSDYKIYVNGNLSCDNPLPDGYEIYPASSFDAWVLNNNNFNSSIRVNLFGFYAYNRALSASEATTITTDPMLGGLIRESKNRTYHAFNSKFDLQATKNDEFETKTVAPVVVKLQPEKKVPEGPWVMSKQAKDLGFSFIDAPGKYSKYPTIWKTGLVTNKAHRAGNGIYIGGYGSGIDVDIPEKDLGPALTNEMTLFVTATLLQFINGTYAPLVRFRNPNTQLAKHAISFVYDGTKPGPLFRNESDSIAYSTSVSAGTLPLGATRTIVATITSNGIKAFSNGVEVGSNWHNGNLLQLSGLKYGYGSAKVGTEYSPRMLIHLSGFAPVALSDKDAKIISLNPYFLTETLFKERRIYAFNNTITPANVTWEWGGN